jgi:hypothetical protein
MKFRHNKRTHFAADPRRFVYPWGMHFTRVLIKVNKTAADNINSGPTMEDSIIRDPMLIIYFLEDITFMGIFLVPNKIIVPC